MLDWNLKLVNLEIQIKLIWMLISTLITALVSVFFNTVQVKCLKWQVCNKKAS